jgi:hypothetical protein
MLARDGSDLSHLSQDGQPNVETAGVRLTVAPTGKILDASDWSELPGLALDPRSAVYSVDHGPATYGHTSFYYGYGHLED